jgi:hypothetical protein
VYRYDMMNYIVYEYDVIVGASLQLRAKDLVATPLVGFSSSQCPH